MKTRLIVFAIITVLLLLVVTYVNLKQDTETEVQPVSYGFVIADSIVNDGSYNSSDIDTKMEFFYDQLISISVSGTDKYPDYRVDPDSIVVDSANKTISFCDSLGSWWRYEFSDGFMVECTTLQELWGFVRRSEFKNADIDTQMEMFTDKLASMTPQFAERFNGPRVISDSIEIDYTNKVIYYRFDDDSGQQHYSFLAQSFTEIITPTPV